MPRLGKDPGLQDLAAEVFDEIVIGKIAFNAPDRMRVGDDTRIQVRIGKTETCDLVRGFEGPGAIKVKDVQVGTLLRVVLFGNEFNIKPLSTQDQPVLDRGYTQWEWSVTPQKSGIHTLYIRVTLRIKIPNQDTEYLDRPVLSEPITVDVNPLFTARKFVEANWQWAAGSLTPAAIGAAVWQYVRRRRSQQASSTSDEDQSGPGGYL